MKDFVALMPGEEWWWMSDVMDFILEVATRCVRIDIRMHG
jgi:hypothetical protein